MSTYPNLLDQQLAEDLRDILSCDRRLARCSVGVEVRGGVAHLRGQSGSAEQRELLRRLVARVRGVHAVWDLVTAPEEEQPQVLDLGCGNNRQWPEAVGVDRHAYAAVDVVVDAVRGLPFADDRVDHVYAVHFLEHVADLIGLMNEIHRVLKPGGVLHVMVPNWRFINAVADPTHVRFFDRQTFKFFCRPYPGMLEFRPICVSAQTDNIFADLQPIKDGEPRNSDELLSRFFE